jgi:FkbM family methyltransferase
MSLQIYNFKIWNKFSILMYLDRDDSAHRDVLAHFSHGQLYEHETSLFFTKVLRPNDVIIDVGANAGYFSFLGSAIIGPQGRILSLEANPASAAIIRESAKLSQRDNIDVIQCAVSSHAGSVVFHVNGKKDSNGAILTTKTTNMLLLNDEKNIEFTVPSDTLDNILSEKNINSARIIKIDTEGHELHVLKGAHRFLKCGLVDFIICELNLPGLARDGETQESLIGYMKTHEYDCFLLDHSGGMPLMVPYGVKIEQSVTCNILFAKSGIIHEIWPVVKNAPAAVLIQN